MFKVREDKGAVLFEAVILLPITFIVLFAMFLLGLHLHEQTTLDGAVNRGAIYASKILSDPQYTKVTSKNYEDYDKDEVDLESADTDFSNAASIKPYRYFDLNKTEEEGLIKTYVENMIEKSNIGLEDIENVSVNCSIKNVVIYMEVTVTATASYDLPEIFGNFGLPTEYKIESKAVRSVNDPDEFIRNADLAKDVVDDVLEMTGLDSKIDGIKTTVKERFGKIKDFKNKLFK